MKIKIDIEKNFQALLQQEDTDNDRQITVQDTGPKRFSVKTVSGEAFEIAGVYHLSNLLQELALARETGQTTAYLEMNRLFENPVDRLARIIRDYFWDGLTRRVDAEGLVKIVKDEKADASNPPRVYVPFEDSTALSYYQKIAHEGVVPNLEVIRLPQEITPEYVKQINNAPGILSLALRIGETGQLQGVPFVVPGGRFNEMYGWDSYFETLGLLVDERVDLAQAMVDNFIYEIKYYGKILNANRSYYLTRSQPPFLTSMALAVYKHLPKTAENKNWLAEVFRTAIREYWSVWMNRHRLTDTGLSRYYGSGLGMPPETEPTHFDAVLKPYADRAGLDVRTYAKQYREDKIKEPELDTYFVHDHTARESGHDTSYRLENRAAHLNTVDLNALLYKYETDIARTIESEFKDALSMPDGKVERSADWFARAETRKQRMNELMWDESSGMFFDYNFMEKRPTGYESATAFYPLWAGMVTSEQAEALVTGALPLFEAPGGVLAGTEASRGTITTERPLRQWDYPFGWAPHQMLIWQGLHDHGYRNEACRLAYRWLYMIIRNAVDYNGTIPEKYDVVKRTHNVFVEYGNEGTEFEYITREGFGWMNASYQVGLSMLSKKQRVSLQELIPAEWLFGAAPVS